MHNLRVTAFIFGLIPVERKAHVNSRLVSSTGSFSIDNRTTTTTTQLKNLIGPVTTNERDARTVRTLEQSRAVIRKTTTWNYQNCGNSIQRQIFNSLYLIKGGAYQSSFSVLRQYCRMQRRWDDRKFTNSHNWEICFLSYAFLVDAVVIVKAP